MDIITNKLEKIKLDKGHNCSVNGKKYEIKIYNVIKNTVLNDKPFNTQSITELGGCRSINDIQCNYNNIQDIGIEIKIYKTPDWMQCSLKYNDGKWIPSFRSQIPIKSQNIFTKLVNNINLFDGKKPPFFEKNLTIDEWKEIKKSTNIWNDTYYDIPNNTIQNLYSEKNCYYLQISKYGLYHLGNDICEFSVPYFTIEQQLRIRIKVHTKKNSKGYCVLSVCASCQPKKIALLQISPYSLDDINKLPSKLKVINNNNF